MDLLDNEEVRLRALLSLITGNDRYTRNIPEVQQFVGLYPEIMGQDDSEALEKLKIRLDAEFLEEDKILSVGRQKNLKKL